MISDSLYIKWLRKRHGVHHTLNLLNLSVFGPGWYFISDLADDCGTSRSSLNNSMIRLRNHELIAYQSYGTSGTFLWWIKQHLEDDPEKESYPRWIVEDITKEQNRNKIIISFGEQDTFASDCRLNPKTVRNFLHGRSHLLDGRYRIVETPFTQYKK